jgi:dTDP-glucose pyrophosphorylase
VKAILLAAGRGTRLGELTEQAPKALIEVGRKPVIVHILDGLIGAGIRELAVVTGYLGGQLEAALGNGAQSGVRLTYLEQKELDGTARALALARDFAGDESFFFSWADILVEPSNYRAVMRKGRFADGAIAVNEVDDPWSGGAVYVDESLRVTRVVEKPPKGTSTTRWNSAGFGVLGPAIWPAIDRLIPSERGEYELTTAIAALVDQGREIRAVPVEGRWFDIGTPESLAAARAAFG